MVTVTLAKGCVCLKFVVVIEECLDHSLELAVNLVYSDINSVRYHI